MKRKPLKIVWGILFPIVYAGVIQFLICRPVFLWLRTFFPKIPYLPYLLVTLFLSSSLFLSFRIKNKRVSAVFHFIGEFLFVPRIVAAPLIIIASIVSKFVRNFQLREVGLLILGAFLVVSAIGILNAFIIREKHYFIQLEKPCKHLRIALISDLHLGAFSDKDLSKRIVNAVKRTGADLVIIAGDLFDGRFAALRHKDKVKEDLKALSEKQPVYCCNGNHDLFDPSEERSRFVEELGIHWLQDELAEFEGYQILLRRDTAEKDRAGVRELLKDVDDGRPVIAVSHHPSDRDELWEAGVDITLSGHTHGGQTFPGNLFYKLSKVQSYGLGRNRNQWSVVTSGIGFYGIPIRFLVNNEVVVIDVNSNMK